MATSVTDLNTALAYRLGKASVPSDVALKARWLQWFNDAYFTILGRKYWWFTEKTATFNTVANQQGYTTAGGFPSDYRDMVEFRVDGEVYTPVEIKQVYGQYEYSDYTTLSTQTSMDKHYYIFADTIYILPTPASVMATTLKYYYLPTKLTSASTTMAIPDMYSGALVSFAHARHQSLSDMRGDAADSYKEFEEIVVAMTVEHNKRMMWGKSRRPVDPIYLMP